MSSVTERSAEWIYRGIWLFLVECFRVPAHSPTLPTTLRGELRVFPPSRRYLSYMKLYFWIGLMVIDVGILAGWLVLYWQYPLIAWILAIPALVIAIVPDIIAYIAIHLRYDTIWYAISDRGVHLRRGIIVITEHTVSLANIQNVSVVRGPVEQCFDLGTIVVETAGSSPHEDPDSLSVGNRVIMVGLSNVDEIRELLMSRVRAFHTAGLGDELDQQADHRWKATDVQLLREIRDELKSA